MIEKVKRLEVSGIPIIHEIAERIGIRDIIAKFIPIHGNEKFSAVDSLIILSYNLAKGREPLYRVNDWILKHDGRCFKYFPKDNLSDDALGRALDKLYHADRATMMTEIVVKMVKTFDLGLHQIHNDSTTVKAYGKYPGKASSGFELKRGHSKDHRPDLKQLMFSLSTSADGFVPVHYKAYPGNRTDDSTHIETWEVIRKIANKSDFVYVADSKVCTKKQLNHITRNGGRVITIVPKTWKAGKEVREELRKGKKITKNLIWRRVIDPVMDEYEYFSLLTRKIKTEDGHRVYWIYSNKKKEKDKELRERKLKRTENNLKNIESKLNTRSLKTEKNIRKTIDKTFQKHCTERFYHIKIGKVREGETKQVGSGRPGKNTRYRRVSRYIYTLSWERNKQALKNESNTDGIFPLLSTDLSIDALTALKAYKYQPRLEKRFTQFKSIHAAAPLLFKSLHRIESIMFLFFLSLMIQALIEREVRLKMSENGIKSLPVYPEGRESVAPTTSKILSQFDGISSYKLTIGKETKEFRDNLNPLQEQLLDLMRISPLKYWGC